MNSTSLSQNVYLLYFLFVATLVHLGYFAIHYETQSMVLFALTVVFVYLINKNMVIVLGISIVFTDLLYLIQRMPEGLENQNDSSYNKYDSSHNLIPDLSGVLDISGNILKSININSTMANSTTGNSKTGNSTTGNSKTGNSKTGNSTGKTESMTNPVKPAKPTVKPSNPVKNKNIGNAVNPVVQTAETIGKKGKEGMEGRDLNDVQQDSDQLKTLLSKMKESPELADSFKQLPGLDISELNKLMNKLNKVVDTFV